MKVQFRFTSNNFNIGLKEVNLIKCNKPAMNDIHGRTWDVIGRTCDGVDIHADTTWGFYGYLQISNQWYKFDMSKAKTISL